MTPQQQQQQEQQVTSLINFDTASNDPLNRFIKNYLEDCSKCKQNPTLLLTSEKIPCCREHWEQLADKNISWSSAQQ